MKKITVMVPCYNEEESLPLFYKELTKIFAGVKNYQLEIFFINDGSKDGTLRLLKGFAEQDRRVSYLDLSRNFGKEAAVAAGFDFLDTDAVILMDADLQDPPSLLPEMIKAWEEGYQDVCAKRRSRAGESWLKKTSSHLYYLLLQKVAKIPVQPDVGDFRLLDRQCIEAMKNIRETRRYTKGLLSFIGFKKKEILFDRDARVAGKTHWNYFSLINLAIEGITSFTTMPLRLAAILGVVIALGAFIYLCFIIFARLTYDKSVPGYPSLIAVVLLMGGGQLVFLGVVGEYLGQVYSETKRRPLYFVNDYRKCGE